MSTLGYLQFFLSSALILAVISLGLNIQWGFTGLFNAGIADFVAVGAYVSALLTTAPVAERIGGFGWPIVCGWIAAVLACDILAALIGSVTLRLREDYLAITTFGIAIVIQLLLVNQQGWTGGPFGVSFIPKMFESLTDKPLLFSTLNSLLMIAVVGSQRQPRKFGQYDKCGNCSFMARISPVRTGARNDQENPPHALSGIQSQGGVCRREG